MTAVLFARTSEKYEQLVTRPQHNKLTLLMPTRLDPGSLEVVDKRQLRSKANRHQSFLAIKLFGHVEQGGHRFAEYPNVFGHSAIL